MTCGEKITIARVFVVSQWEKIIVTLVVTCALPFLVHVLPVSAAGALGARWLPIFYAPLVAALFFRPHVALIAAGLGPLINHALFGMPTAAMVAVLTAELVFFSVAVIALKEARVLRWWRVVLSLISVRLIVRAVFFHGVIRLDDVFFAWPGFLAVAVLTEVFCARETRPRA